MSFKKNILLKLSGASLKGENDIICNKKINKLALDIIEASKNYNIGIVIGGGNIWRGNIADSIGMDKCNADDMGMLATVINSLALKATISSYGKDVEVYSALSIPRLVKEHNSYNFKRDLALGKIVIFAGGTGMPFFSTDTGASLTASEINAEYILMGKNNIDGLYDKDPNKYNDAQFIEAITFEEVINRKLMVADLTCMTMCMENNIEILIFDIEKNNSIANALNKTGKFSRVFNGEKTSSHKSITSPSSSVSETKFNHETPDVVFEDSSKREKQLFDQIEISLNKNKEVESKKEFDLYEYKGLNDQGDAKAKEVKSDYLNYTSVEATPVQTTSSSLNKVQDNSDELRKMIERNKEWLSKK